MELTGKQKRYLRGLAHHLNPVVYAGKEGVSEAVERKATQELEHHELIKLKLGDGCLDDWRQLLARTAPIGPEVDDNGEGVRCLDDFAFEVRSGDVKAGHWSHRTRRRPAMSEPGRWGLALSARTPRNLTAWSAPAQPSVA